MNRPVQRRVLFEHIVNCRDLGGYPCADGAVTRFDRLFRCGIPRDPTPRDMEALYQRGIRTVIDLRGDLEAIERPSAFLNHPDLEYRQISLLEVNPAITDERTLLSDIYKRSVKEYAGNYARAFSALAAVKTPAVFHCFLGKDRTGILACMLLSLTGVCREDIVADYQLSGTYLRPFYKRETEQDTGLIWENNDDHLMSEPHNIEMLMDFLDDRYGGVREYLLAAGVSAQELDAAGRLLL